MSSAKKPTNKFNVALRAARRCQGLSQEDFSVESSRTYISSLERGLKSPTLNKVDELAKVLDIHPLTLLVLAYAPNFAPGSIENLQRLIASEIDALGELER